MSDTSYLSVSQESFTWASIIRVCDSIYERVLRNTFVSACLAQHIMSVSCATHYERVLRNTFVILFLPHSLPAPPWPGLQRRGALCVELFDPEHKRVKCCARLWAICVWLYTCSLVLSAPFCAPFSHTSSPSGRARDCWLGRGWERERGHESS